MGTGPWRLVDWVGRLPGAEQAALVLAVVVVVGCLITFWAPVPLGLLAAHTLRRRRAL